jgi:hypothetical protein
MEGQHSTRTFLGGGLALLFRLPMAGWLAGAAALVRDLCCPQQLVNQPMGCLLGVLKQKDSSDQILLTGAGG